MNLPETVSADIRELMDDLHFPEPAADTCWHELSFADTKRIRAELQHLGAEVERLTNQRATSEELRCVISDLMTQCAEARAEVDRVSGAYSIVCREVETLQDQLSTLRAENTRLAALAAQRQEEWVEERGRYEGARVDAARYQFLREPG